MQNGILRVSLVLLLRVLALCAPTGSAEAEVNSRAFFAMDTYMEISASIPADSALFDDAEAEVRRLGSLLSVTQEGSELWALNHAQGQSVSLSDETADLLQSALDLCDETEGALNIALYPVICEWGFTTGEFQIPDDQRLEELLKLCDWRNVRLEGAQASLGEGMALDLGAVGKGYASDVLAGMFRDAGVESALLSLGGNVYALGNRPDGTPWRVGLQNPMGEDVIGVLLLSDQAAITSGGYQRYFEADGQTWHHIIDGETGYPAQSGLLSVTVVSGSGLVGDALSTALFVMGAEEAVAYWREHRDFEMILICEDGAVIYTQGLEGAFTVNAPVEVTVVSGA